MNSVILSFERPKDHHPIWTDALKQRIVNFLYSEGCLQDLNRDEDGNLIT